MTVSRQNSDHFDGRSDNINKNDTPGTTPVIDYEGSLYQTDFWEGQGRDYEDAVDRLAIERLLPKKGRRIVELGAAYGRLANLYDGYEQIILFDYSRTLLQDAVKTWGGDERFVFVAGNLYELPFANNVLDTVVMVRVMHHLADVPQALRQIKRILHNQSVAVLEYANKRNLKSVLRWAAKGQQESPFDLSPLEFVELNFNFHPVWMETQFKNLGYNIQQQLGVSNFRLPLLKTSISAKKLAKLDNLLFKFSGYYPLSPSVFIELTVPEAEPFVPKPAETHSTNIANLFHCPSCHSEILQLIHPDLLQCATCGIQYRQKNQIWDFKEPIV